MKIIYNQVADLRNWLRIKRTYPDNFTITEYYPFDQHIDLTEQNIDTLSKTINQDDLINFNNQANNIEAVWSKIEPEILNKIFEYLRKSLPIIDFKANLTTAYLMPYDEKDNWFMVPTHKPINDQLKCIAHELFHLYETKINPLMEKTEREAEVEKFINSIEYLFK